MPPPPSLFHEAPIEVLRRQPRAVLDLLRLARIEVAPGTSTRLSVALVDSELTEPQPRVRHADLVLSVRDASARPVQVVVVEVQSRPSRTKPQSWLHYVAHLSAQHRVPVTLVVLALDDRTARWARRPRDFGPCLRLTPTVLGPADFPEIVSVEQAIVERDLAVLTGLIRLAGRGAATHEDEVARIFEGTLRGRSDALRDIYLSLVHGTARHTLRARLTTLLEADDMGALEIIYEEGKAEGKAEGRAEGEARLLLAILAKRGLVVPPELRQRIHATTDLGLLERWALAALEAATLDAVFAD